MRHRFTSITLGSCFALSLMVSGCTTQHPPTSPAPSTSNQQDLSILKNALTSASQQKYTQIQVSGHSSVPQSYLGTTLPSHIQQTIQVDGVTAKIEQDSAPRIYESANVLFYAQAGRWKTVSLPEPGGSSSGWSNWSVNQIHSLFKTFEVQEAGANKLMFTIVPVDSYRATFFSVVSQALHRVMVGQDPYIWTLSTRYISYSGVPFNNEAVKLTLTKEQGSWVVTDGTWNIAYANSPSKPTKIDLSESYQHQPMPVSIPNNVLDGGKISLGTSGATSKHPDRQIISLTPLNALSIPDFYTSLNAYKMTYWSQNIPVVAYVSVPQQSGSYPLYVQCHGGWVTPVPITHVNTFGVGPAALGFARKNAITVVPMYRGYGDSDGPVSGIAENATDTINAIKAIQSRYKVIKGHIYLDGTSMGGGVVLKVASEQSDIRSVIATSPYVGANVFTQWYLSNQQSAIPHTKGIYIAITNDYGPFDPSQPIYQEESINYRNISAPTLLLQGTGDQTIQWQTVQALYHDMKADHKPVRFDLVKGANHGFTGSFDSVRGDAIVLWYGKYGEGAS